MCSHMLESYISWLLYSVCANIPFLCLSITWHISSSMGGRHGGGCWGWGRGGEQQGGGHQQELSLWSGHPVDPEHTHDLLIAHKSVSDSSWIFSVAFTARPIPVHRAPFALQNKDFPFWPMKEYSSRNRTLTSLKIKQLLFKSFSSHTDKIILSFQKMFSLQGEASWQQPLPGAELPGARRPRRDRRRRRPDRWKKKNVHISEDISSLIRV